MANIKELMHSSFQQSLSLFSNKDTYDYYDYDYGYYSKKAWFRQPLVRWSIYSETIKHAFHEGNYTNGKDCSSQVTQKFPPKFLMLALYSLWLCLTQYWKILLPWNLARWPLSVHALKKHFHIFAALSNILTIVAFFWSIGKSLIVLPTFQKFQSFSTLIP